MAVGTEGPNQVEEFNGPVSTYQVIEAKPSASDARFVAAELDPEEVAAQHAAAQRMSTKSPAAKRGIAKQVQPRTAKQRIDDEQEQPGQSSAKMYVALGAGLGVLTALAIVAFVILPGKPVDTTYDMGLVTSTSTGLKGHLITNWGDRLNYKLTLEPSDANEIDAFATTISNPPQAIQVNVQLKDVSGTVLCENPVLLKYDPLKNIPNVVMRGPVVKPTSKKAAAQAAAEEMAQNQAEIEQSLNKARLVGQELSREHGKDIFQPVTGEDGQISSLAAQGTFPCTRKQYQSAASWSFVTNFPSVLQPGGPESDDNLDAFGVAPGRENGGAAQRSAPRRAPLPHSHFSVEEDDALVGYQAATGIVETRAGKSFLVEKRELVASSLKGVEFPIPIHYRCDQLGACALAGLNSGIQRAWLER